MASAKDNNLGPSISEEDDIDRLIKAVDSLDKTLHAQTLQKFLADNHITILFGAIAGFFALASGPIGWLLGKTERTKSECILVLEAATRSAAPIAGSQLEGIATACGSLLKQGTQSPGLSVLLAAGIGLLIIVPLILMSWFWLYKIHLEPKKDYQTLGVGAAVVAKRLDLASHTRSLGSLVRVLGFYAGLIGEEKTVLSKGSKTPALLRADVCVEIEQDCQHVRCVTSNLAWLDDRITRGNQESAPDYIAKDIYSATGDRPTTYSYLICRPLNTGQHDVLQDRIEHCISSILSKYLNFIPDGTSTAEVLKSLRVLNERLQFRLLTAKPSVQVPMSLEAVIRNDAGALASIIGPTLTKDARKRLVEAVRTQVHEFMVSDKWSAFTRRGAYFPFPGDVVFLKDFRRELLPTRSEASGPRCSILVVGSQVPNAAIRFNETFDHIFAEEAQLEQFERWWKEVW